jgi:hypothetical protein
MKLKGRISLFLSSYLPCWIIIAISQGLVLNKISIFGIIFCIFSIISLYLFDRSYSYPTDSNSQYVKINYMTSGSSEVVSYLITLIIPVATSTTLNTIIKGENLSNILVYLILGLIIFLIYTTTNLVVINPMLIIIGYSLYKITYLIENEHSLSIEAILITKGQLSPDNFSKEILIQKIDNDVFIKKEIF